MQAAAGHSPDRQARRLRSGVRSGTVLETDCFRWFSLILVTKLSHSPADPEPFVFERKIVKLLSKLEKSARSS